MATRAAGDWQPGYLRRVVLASLIGTTIEWYDFFLYGSAAALIFNKLFFPEFDPWTGTFLAFATYALGFVARPVGGIVFGHFGDRIGRKRLLMLSLILMGIATTLIGVLPTYGQAGVLAPLALILLRLVQGFAVGGEWGGAVLLVAEHGDSARRGFWTSWPQAGVPAGNLLAAGVLAILAGTQSDADFLSWGWRIPFLLSAVLVAFGWWIRSSVAETPAFEAALAEAAPPRVPAVDVICEKPVELATGAGLRLGENVSYYIITTFSITYMTTAGKLTKAEALDTILIGAALHFFAIPMLGRLSDRIGRRPVYAIGALGLAGFAFLFFGLIGSGSFVKAVAGIAIALLLHGAMYGPQAAFITELFPTRYRYSGASIAYQLTSIAAGSLAPLVATILYGLHKDPLPVSLYVGACCLVSGLTALLARETKGIDLAAIR